MRVEIDVGYIKRLIDQLADMREPGTRYTRRSFTETYRQSREWLMSEMRSLGLNVRMDAAANIIGDYGQPPLASGRRGVWAIGSHTDTVANGGRFDGIAGVVAGLAVVKALREADFRPKRHLEIIDFLAEEPCAFGLSTVGSRGMVGNLTPEMLDYRAEDWTLAEGITSMGGDAAQLNKCLRENGDIQGFLELHIEQGPVLEKDNLDVGIVTGIAGIHRYRVKVTGEQGHAGTVPMGFRRDALVAASNMVSEIHRTGKQWAAQEQCVATVGVLNVEPNHANVIPGRVTFTLEIRSIAQTTLTELANEMFDKINKVAATHQVSVETETLSQTRPVASDDLLLTTLRNCADSIDLRYTDLPSGAGHDAAQIARIAPMAMVFIPCRGGLSHHPDEFATYEQVAKGAQLLAQAIIELDSRDHI